MTHAMSEPADAAVDRLRARRTGLWTSTLDSLPLDRMHDVAQELDELGYGALWFGEAYGRESFTSAMLLLQAAPRMVIATGIANLYARGAMATAAAARTLEAMAPGRFVLGLGVSHKPLVERDRGETYDRPLPTMRAYLDDMDKAPSLSADAARPPTVLAALGPKMLELARDRTAGAHPYLVTPDHTAQARATLGPGPLLAVEQAVVLGQPRDEALRRAHEHLSIYTGLPNYRNSWLRQGFDERDAVRGGSERLADALVAMGDEQTILDRVRAHLDAGADHVCLQVLGADFGAPALDDWRTLAPALAAV